MKLRNFLKTSFAYLKSPQAPRLSLRRSAALLAIPTAAFLLYHNSAAKAQLAGNKPQQNADASKPDQRRVNSEGPAESVLQDPYIRSRKNLRPICKDPSQPDFVIFTGNGNVPLAQDIANHLGTPLGEAVVSRFADGEVNIKVQENVRGKDVYIIQPTCTPVNDNLMELFLMISTLRRAAARKITAVIPYYGYARQDRKLAARVPISAADVARLLETIGVDRVIAIDLHCGQIQGFFGPRVPVDNLGASVAGLEYFVQKSDIEDMDKIMVISPDAGGVYRAKKFQENLIQRGFTKTKLAMIIKMRAEAGKIERMTLVGDFKQSKQEGESLDKEDAGWDAIIVDDMIDTGGTLCKAASELKKMGVKKVYAFATHGLFSGRAPQLIGESDLEKVIVTNTIPMRQEMLDHKPARDKVVQIPIGMLIAETIRRIHQKESVSEIFEIPKF